VEGGHLLRKYHLTRRQFIAGGIGIIGTTFFLYYERYSVAVTEYRVSIANLPKEFEGFTILHLTDLHSKRYGREQKTLLDLIHQFSFDMVALTGDFIDKDNADFTAARELIQGLRPKPIFFVSGNHEWRYQFHIREPLINEGVHVLQNEAYTYSIGNSHIWIVGVNDPYTHRDDLSKATGRISDQAPKILLAHAPDILTKAAGDDIELVLAGHTHGGQIRLPLLGAIYVPGQALFPKYDYGEFQYKNTSMIINCGLGESTHFPFRFCSRPEIVLVKLVS